MAVDRPTGVLPKVLKSRCCCPRSDSKSGWRCSIATPRIEFHGRISRVVSSSGQRLPGGQRKVRALMFHRFLDTPAIHRVSKSSPYSRYLSENREWAKLKYLHP